MRHKMTFSHFSKDLIRHPVSGGQSERKGERRKQKGESRKEKGEIRKENFAIKQEQRKFIYSAEREQSQERKAGLKENHPKNNPHKHRVLVWICLYYILLVSGKTFLRP